MNVKAAALAIATFAAVEGWMNSFVVESEPVPMAICNAVFLNTYVFPKMTFGLEQSLA